MDKDEIVRRLEKLAGHAVHVIGEQPLVMSLEDGIALSEAVLLLKEFVPVCRDGEICRCKRGCKWCKKAVKWE